MVEEILDVYKSEKVWRTYSGVKIKFSDLDHQHLSNILWYMEVFYKEFFSKAKLELEEELNTRFDGQRLIWRPLPIPGEVISLIEMGYLIRDGLIRYPNGNKIGMMDPEKIKQYFV